MMKIPAATPAQAPQIPWRRRTREGVYFGHRGGGTVAYFELPLTPLHWEDATERLSEGRKLDGLLAELGATAADLGGGMRQLAIKRGVHVFAATFDRFGALPEDVAAPQRNFLARVLPEIEPSKTLLVGVKLWPSFMRTLVKGGGGGGNLLTQAKAMMSKDEDTDSFEGFLDDYNDVKSIVFRAGGRLPRPEALTQLESWFSEGQGPEVPTQASTTSIRIPGGPSWEIAAVTDFSNAIMESPNSQWILDAMTHSDPAVVVSIRAELVPASIIQAQLRASQRRLRANEEEEAKTGDITRDEIGEKTQFAKQLENSVRQSQNPWMTDTSVLMAREYYPLGPGDTYLDMLRSRYGIEAKVLEHRQLDALDEMQPCSTKRPNPFLQVINPALVGYSGLPAFSNIGDATGLWMGQADPDFTSVMLDPFRASNTNKPPAMAIFGDPGSGKAQPVSALVLTPTGWVRMADLRVGSRVVGSDGRPTIVTGIYPQGEKAIFEVAFDDGASTRATADHLWRATRRDPSHLADDRVMWETVTTAEMDAHLAQGGRWWFPVAAPAHLTHRDVDVPAYEVGAAMAARGTAVSRIPQPYMLGSLDQRVAVLQGMLDHAGRLDFSVGGLDPTITWTGPEGLRTDLVDLIRGLGGTAVVEGSERVVRMRVPAEVAPFTDLLRARAWRTATALNPSRRIYRQLVGVRESGVEVAQCIGVDALDHLYVTEDHLLTHNTFAAQLLAAQAALSGVQTVMINPKGFDTLAPFAEWVGSQGVTSNVIVIQGSKAEGGSFDPWRYAGSPAEAAEILSHHIMSVIGSQAHGLSVQQEILMQSELKRASEAGARCAGEALAHVSDASVRNLVLSLVDGSEVFALGFSHVPLPRFDFGTGGLTLVEFGKNLPLPSAKKPTLEYEQAERVAVAAMRLVTRAAMEILMASGGGVLIVDEAHHYLGSAEGLASLQKMGREGRSQGLLPIFLTQRVSDLTGADMENYLSRVLVMKLTDPVQATEALRLCGLQATEDRIEFLREAGPQRSSEGVPGRGALGFLRDTEDRHSVLMIGPVPEDVRFALSTNREDKLARQQSAAA